MQRLDIAHTLDCIEEIAAYWVMIVRGFRWAAGACQVLFECALNPVQFNTKLTAASYLFFRQPWGFTVSRSSRYTGTTQCCTGEISVRELLLVDDQSADLKNATEVAEALGFEKIHTRNSIHAARTLLEEGLAGNGSLPDGIVLDLDLGMDSGFELLRMWHGTPRLAAIPILVWSVLDQQKEMCELFKVTCFVSKWEGMGAFREKLSQLIPPSQ
jgi:CheY-like chemotaxis protein